MKKTLTMCALGITLALPVQAELPMYYMMGEERILNHSLLRNEVEEFITEGVELFRVVDLSPEEREGWQKQVYYLDTRNREVQEKTLKRIAEYCGREETSAVFSMADLIRAQNESIDYRDIQGHVFGEHRYHLQEIADFFNQEKELTAEEEALQDILTYNDLLVKTENKYTAKPGILFSMTPPDSMYGWQPEKQSMTMHMLMHISYTQQQLKKQGVHFWQHELDEEEREFFTTVFTATGHDPTDQGGMAEELIACAGTNLYAHIAIAEKNEKVQEQIRAYMEEHEDTIMQIEDRVINYLNP